MSFSYNDCPKHDDGFRRAVLRKGGEVVLLCDNAPHPDQPIVGYPMESGVAAQWSTLGYIGIGDNDFDILVPL